MTLSPALCPALANTLDEIYAIILQDDLADQLDQNKRKLEEFAMAMEAQYDEQAQKLDALQAENNELSRILTAVIMRLDALQARLR